MFIEQRTLTDCGICTIAMATARPYDEVLEVAVKTDAWHPDKGMRSEYLVLEQFGLKQMQDFRVMHRAVLSPEYFLHFSWKRRAILAVPSLNTEGLFHSVYWTGSELRDPCTRKRYERWEELRPDEIILFSDAPR